MSNSSIDGLQQAYINLIQTSNMNNLCLVAAVALYAYDYLLTFSGEVELIWRRKFTGVTVLFVLNRYTGVLLQISELLSMLPLKDRSVLSCRPLATLTDVCNLLIIMVDALFSALRIYAIWNGDWRPAILVPVLAFIYIGIAVGVMSTQQVSLAPPPLNTCGTVFTMDPSIRTKLSNALYTCTIAGNILVLIFTWIRTYGIHKLTSEAHTKASIATLILRDGTVIWGFTFVLSLANVVCSRLAIFNPGGIFSQAVTPMLISRFMLSLREVHLSGAGSGRSSTFGSMQSPSINFASNVIGVMGAPLALELCDGYMDADDISQPPLISDNPLAAGLWDVDADLDGTGQSPHVFTRAEDADLGEVDKDAV